GMGRRRLAALLFAESAVLTLFGGIAASVVVTSGSAWMRRVLLPGMLDESGVDWTTLAVSATALVATALLTGLVPVLQTRTAVTAGLRDGAQHGATRRSRVYWTLLVSQTALSTVLLV